jgi:hypothetical protein
MKFFRFTLIHEAAKGRGIYRSAFPGVENETRNVRSETSDQKPQV